MIGVVYPDALWLVLWLPCQSHMIILRPALTNFLFLNFVVKMSTTGFKNNVAVALNTIGLSLCVARIVVILLFFGNAYRLQHIIMDLSLILNTLIYLTLFVLVLSKPAFVSSNKGLWYGFAAALANDVLTSILVLNIDSLHGIHKILLVFQLSFNFVMMVGSFFNFTLFLPQGKPKGIPTMTTPTPMQSYQAPVHLPSYISAPTMSPLPPNPYKS